MRVVDLTSRFREDAPNSVFSETSCVLVRLAIVALWSTSGPSSTVGWHDSLSVRAIIQIVVDVSMTGLQLFWRHGVVWIDLHCLVPS